MHHKGFFTSVLNIQVIQPIKLYTAWRNDFFFEWYVFALELSSFFSWCIVPGLCFAIFLSIWNKFYCYKQNDYIVWIIQQCVEVSSTISTLNPHPIKLDLRIKINHMSSLHVIWCPDEMDLTSQSRSPLCNMQSMVEISYTIFNVPNWAYNQFIMEILNKQYLVDDTSRNNIIISPWKWWNSWKLRKEQIFHILLDIR